jgi:hypothetical protein
MASREASAQSYLDRAGLVSFEPSLERAAPQPDVRRIKERLQSLGRR